MRNTGKNISITVNDLSVSYTDEGPVDAPVIIFIHGFPLNNSMWDMQVEALKDQYRVVAYDVRGHGNTDPGTYDFSIEQFAVDLINFMDAIRIEKAILCGLSMGGYIALNAVNAYRERFDALILCDTQCMADTPEAKEKRMKSIAVIRENGLELYANESLNNLFAPESLSAGIEEIAAVKMMIMKTSEKSLISTIHALADRKDTCSKLPDIEIPVLIIAGKEDKITPPSVAQKMHVMIKASVLCIIEHAGHLSNLENPDEFNRQLTRFFGTVY